MILINLKTYKESFGEKGIELARLAYRVSKQTGVRIVVASGALSAGKIMEETGAEVWLQHVDQYPEGKYTGWIPISQALEMGIKGSLLNHSEHKIPKGTISKILKSKPKGFEIMVCAGSRGQMEKWGHKIKPEWFLYEPPELIASTTTSVALAKPEAIKNAVEAAGGTKLIVGAGVKSKEDVVISLKLGAKGVGLSSALVLGKNPEKLLTELAGGFKDFE